MGTDENRSVAAYNRKHAPMTGEQEMFLRDLLKDLRRLFLQPSRRKTEADLVAWMGGLMNRHIVQGQAGFWQTWEAVEETVYTLDAARARRLIAALLEVRKRMVERVSREDLATPKHLLKAIWTTMRSKAIPEDALRAAVLEATNGETESTKNLRPDEAVALLKAMGAPPQVYQFVQSGNRTRLRKRTA